MTDGNGLSQPAAGGARTLALIADDAPEFRAGIAAAIRRSDPAIRIVEADTGVEARNVLLKRRPQLAFLNLQLPKLSGAEALAWAVARGIKPFTVLMSGAVPARWVELSIELQAYEFLRKPFDPAHVTHLFKDKLDAIAQQGEVEVELAGRAFRIRREFVDDIAEQRLVERVTRLRKALLIFHSPTDDTVGIENASEIFLAAKHPKSFISLAGADHLLSKRSDAVYVANVLAAWAERYLDTPTLPQSRGVSR